jgi:hypothetical protein
MKWNEREMRRIGLLTVICVTAAAGPSAADKHPTAAQVVLLPHLVQGQSFRYEYEFRRDARISTESMIIDPHPETSEQLTLSVTLRIEVLGVLPDAVAARGPSSARLRVTYERVAATMRSDNPAADAEQPAKNLRAQEKQAFECTLSAKGEIADCAGPEQTVIETQAAVGNLLGQIFRTAALPARGVAVGESWGAEQEAGGAIPLAGLRWVSQSMYAHNEPCLGEPPWQSGEKPLHPAANAESCAVLRTRSLLTRTGAGNDTTPEEFRQKDLRTAGTARGANETLAYVSLLTGLTMRASESGQVSSDVSVSSTRDARKIRTKSEVKTETHLSIIPSLD